MTSKATNKKTASKRRPAASKRTARIDKATRDFIKRYRPALEALAKK